MGLEEVMFQSYLGVPDFKLGWGTNCEVVSKIFRTGAAIYAAVVVAQSTGPNWPNCEFWVLLRRFTATVETCEYVTPNSGENRPGCFTITKPCLTLLSSPSSFW